MASRKADKEAARQRRLEQERAAKAVAQRRQRLTIAGGLLVVVIAVAVVLVIVLGSGSGSNKSVAATHPHSKQAKTAAATVDALLKGIPQHGNTLGNPKAPVTFTEYGDLECSVCDAFALDGAENSLISNEVRSGKVKLVYKSLLTATNELSNASTIFPLQQSAAYAAGAQNKAWNYIELFYHEQGKEGTGYVNTQYLTGLAKQIPGLDVKRWNGDRFNPSYAQQIDQEAREFQGLGVQAATPTLIAAGPKSQTRPAQGAIPYSEVQSMIKSVSS